MTQHIIDTDELEKLFRYSNPLTGKKLIAEDDLCALIANSPQADGMVLGKVMHTLKCYRGEIAVSGKRPNDLRETDEVIAMLSAYKPQADDVPPDVYDIVVDTGDGIYYTAEVVHFQQSGSKRMIQVKIGEPETQADDVRKDDWISVEDRLPECNVMVLIHDESLAKRDRIFNEKEFVKRSAGVRIGVMYHIDEGLRSEGSNGRCDVTHWQPLPAPPLDKAKG